MAWVERYPTVPTAARAPAAAAVAARIDCRKRVPHIAMPSQRTEFTGSQGATLAARLDTPDTPPRAWAIFAHSFTRSKDTKAAAHIARAGHREPRRAAF